MNNLENMRQELITHRAKIIKLAKEIVLNSIKNRTKMQISPKCSTKEYRDQMDGIYKYLYKNKG